MSEAAEAREETLPKNVSGLAAYVPWSEVEKQPWQQRAQYHGEKMQFLKS